MIDKLTHEQKEIALNSVKLGGVWASVGVSTWSDAASMFAAILSVLFILEWIWKKVIRPLLEKYGLIERNRRRATDSELERDRSDL